MRYMKEILLKNKMLVVVYIATGILIAFLSNYKIDYLQKVINGLTDSTLTLGNIIVYGVILISYYVVNYIDEYPGKKLENGSEAGKSILYDFWLCLLRQLIPTICFSHCT